MLDVIFSAIGGLWPMFIPWDEMFVLIMFSRVANLSVMARAL
jgi:hypothetical protein